MHRLHRMPLFRCRWGISSSSSQPSIEDSLLQLEGMYCFAHSECECRGDRTRVQGPAYDWFKLKQNNLLPLPPGRTLIFERNESATEGSFVCSACGKDFDTANPAEGMAQFNLHKCERKRKRADG